jgi:2-enoate reductase
MDGHTVTVVEMLGKIVAKDDINANNEMKLSKLLADNSVKLIFNAKAKKFDAKGMTVEVDGKEKVVACKTVLVAAGMKSNDALVEQLYDHFDHVHVIGDANKPGRIMEAVHQGYAVANNMF